MKPQLRRLGYWSEGPGSPWPDPRDLVDPTWDEGERETVALYLSQASILFASMGASRCRFCGKANGTLELTDGLYVWPEGLAHYVSHHDVRMPAEFVEHVQTRLESLTNASVDAEWWRRATRQGDASS